MKAFTLSNKGYIEFTENLLKSIKYNNIEIDLDICVLDDFSYRHFSKLEQNVIKHSDKNLKKFLKQDSKGFGEYMIFKIETIHNYLMEFDKVLYLDGDIVIKNNIIKYLDKELENFELVIQNDLNPKKPEIEYLCAGFMAIKSNHKTREFFNIKNISREQILTGLHDQGYINLNKNKLEYKILPLDKFPNGAHYYNNSENLDPWIIHFNYVIGKKKKKIIKNFGEWYL